VKCGSITVLAGASGVGKSSLAMLYGDVLAGDNSSPRDGTHMIHVSPSWLEKSDLLGYVNTITRDFAPAETGLYQQLIYAQEDYKRNNADSAIYPICLDEMNLAQIEYYFSDFMQILELPQENQNLTCFSPQAVIASSVFKNYSSIKLSPALRFIGTVNFDETTKRLSMRLLDRINLIQLSNCSEFWDPRCENVTAGDGVSYANYSKWIRDESLPANIEAYLEKLANPLQQLGVVISPRVKFAIGRYVASSNPFFDNRNDAEKSAFDEQIAQRVLSKIRSVRGQRSALDEISKIILDFCQGMQCEKILKQLREQDEIWSDSLLGED
jgi:hypothetical protein